MPVFQINISTCAGMGMRSANGEFNPLQFFVTFDFEIDGIHREVSAFVRPEVAGKSPSSDLSLILGQPWIWSIHGVPDVRHGTLYFGDETRGEPRKVLNTTKFFESKYQKLLLVPDLPDYREKAGIAEGIMEQQQNQDFTMKRQELSKLKHYITNDGRLYNFERVSPLTTIQNPASETALSTTTSTDQIESISDTDSESPTESSQDADNESRSSNSGDKLSKHRNCGPKKSLNSKNSTVGATIKP
ncbi:hypothetical protein K3495_g7380 [Podosphaera aphanis]|nr:hypothetical protein K3495_g7380 [Podosphaera aphanis]